MEDCNKSSLNSFIHSIIHSLFCYYDDDDFEFIKNEISEIDFERIIPQSSIFKPFAIKFAPGVDQFRDLEWAKALRNQVLSMVENDGAVILEMVSSSRIFGKHARNKIKNEYDGTIESLELVIIHLMIREVKNHHPELLQLIEKCIIILILKKNNEWLGIIKSGDEYRSLLTLSCIMDYYVYNTYKFILENYCKGAIVFRVERAMGISTDHINYFNTAVKNRHWIIKTELELCQDLLKLRDSLIVFCYELKPNQMEICFDLFVPVDEQKRMRPMFYFDGPWFPFNGDLRIVQRRFGKYCEYDFHGRYGFIVVVYLVLRRGKLKPKRGKAVGPLGAWCTDMALRLIGMSHREVKSLKRQIDRMTKVTTIQKPPTSVLKREDNLCYNSVILCENNTLQVIPVKDVSLIYKHWAANDHSYIWSYNFLHQKSIYYKIMFGNLWIGYVAILDVCDNSGCPALVIDRFNMRFDPQWLRSTLYNSFVKEIVRSIRNENYRWILAPSEECLLSSRKEFRSEVWKSLLLNKRIPNEFYLKPPDDTFRSMKATEYIVLYDREAENETNHHDITN